jgi:FkbM family methyltransferase
VSHQPLWVSIVRAIVGRTPRGKYAIVSRWSPRRGRFVARLSRDLGGAKFECDLADIIAREVCLTGYYEPPVTRVAQQLTRPGGTVVDAGANWGYFTLLAASAVGEGGRVLALEPDPRHFERLTRNITLNQFSQVTTLQIAAGSCDGLVTVIGYPDEAENRGVSRIAGTETATHGFEVRSTSIDGLTASDRRIDVVKIDVEGAELDVLTGMRNGLSTGRYASILLELHPALLREQARDPAKCIETLLEYGYRGCSIDLTPRAYRSALARDTPIEELLMPVNEWRHTAWPHQLWLAPGESLVAC